MMDAFEDKKRRARRRITARTTRTRERNEADERMKMKKTRVCFKSE